MQLNMNFPLGSEKWAHVIHRTDLIFFNTIRVFVLETHWWNLSARCRWCTAARRTWRWTRPLTSSGQWWCRGRRCTARLLWMAGWGLHAEETTTWFILKTKVIIHNLLDLIRIFAGILGLNVIHFKTFFKTLPLYFKSSSPLRILTVMSTY